MSIDFQGMRRDYSERGLREEDAGMDPMAVLRRWLLEAEREGVREPNAATLATASRDGLPSARIVLVKGIDDRSLLFYTSYEGRKARELRENPHAAICLFWPALERQVRIEGAVAHAAPAESDAYFATRPRDAQLSAWTSAQSAPISSREELEARRAAMETRFPGAVPRPPGWGGYRLTARAVELWQGRKSRLHDRLRYAWDGETWGRERLQP